MTEQTKDHLAGIAGLLGLALLLVAAFSLGAASNEWKMKHYSRFAEMDAENTRVTERLIQTLEDLQAKYYCGPENNQ